MKTNKIDTPSGLDLYWRGPSLDHGQLPGVFYFALSGEDSLSLDPFNQPAVFLDSFPVRVYSSTLPSHGSGLRNSDAMGRWAQDLENGHDLLTEFIDKCLANIDFLIAQGLLDRDRIAVSGLSRGGFLALHLAAADPRISVAACFAPVTALTALKEFQPIRDNPLVSKLDLSHCLDALCEKKVKIYSGNLDTRIGTRNCFDFVEKLAMRAFEKGVRSPPVELLLSPSIGHKGHGTPPHIFEQGAQWIWRALS